MPKPTWRFLVYFSSALAVIAMALFPLSAQSGTRSESSRESTAAVVREPPARLLEPADLAEIRRRILGPSMALLVYRLGDEHSEVQVSTRKCTRSWQLAGRAELESEARELSRHWRSRHGKAHPRMAELELELAKKLFADALEDLDAKYLVIVTEGELRWLSFNALPDPRAIRAGAETRPPRRLVDSFAVVQFDSLSELGRLGAEDPEKRLGTRSVAIIADPVSGYGDPRLGRGERRRVLIDDNRASPSLGGAILPRLTHAEREAEQILEKAEGIETYSATGFAARREVLTQGAVAPYSIVHLAAHGFPGDPDGAPGMIFSRFDEGGRPIEGLLGSDEVYELHFGAELVVLSGCKTGIGPDLASGGFHSLGRAFLHAGARQVVVSLWDVSDRSTAELMDRFYEHLLAEGLPPVEALAAAQASMAHDPTWARPYHWAGFVLQGDWR